MPECETLPGKSPFNRGIFATAWPAITLNDSDSLGRGESFLQPSIAAKVVAEFNRLSQPCPAPTRPGLREPLSDRECQFLQKLAEGKSNKEIAGVLNLAEGTVINHLSNIFGKLGVLDRTQAALMARELGLL